MDERTLVILKPDAMKRGLAGSILERFERSGLKIVGCKFLKATREQIEGHFHGDESWVAGMGAKTLEGLAEYGVSPLEMLGTDDPLVIGNSIKQWNLRYLASGPILAVVLQGVHAISTVRKMIGHTLPYKAAPGTIRGDYSINSPLLANAVGAACRNLIHASGEPAEAELEIKNWFTPNELIVWDRADDFAHFVEGEFTSASNEVTTMETTDTTKPDLTSLERKLEELKRSDPREAGEHAYVLARLYERDGNVEKARRFGDEAIKLFDSTPNETLADCAARNSVIEGIALPDIIHAAVVRDRLSSLAL